MRRFAMNLFLGEEFLGMPTTRRKIRFDIRGRGRFVDGKLAGRWDQADFADIKRQLTGLNA